MIKVSITFLSVYFTDWSAKYTFKQAGEHFTYQNLSDIKLYYWSKFGVKNCWQSGETANHCNLQTGLQNTHKAGDRNFFSTNSHIFFRSIIGEKSKWKYPLDSQIMQFSIFNSWNIAQFCKYMTFKSDRFLENYDSCEREIGQ